MRRLISKQNFKRTASRILLAAVPLILTAAERGHTQSDLNSRLKVSYFVSPEYPSLARQAMQSGDVVLTVTVDPSGKPTDIQVKAPHILLAESAKKTVSKWLFVPVAPPTVRKGQIFIHYGFSGTSRDCNPNTVVAVDLETPRVIVTIDPRPRFDPDAFPAPANPTKTP